MPPGAPTGSFQLFTAISAHPKHLIGESLAGYSEGPTGPTNGPFLVTFDMPAPACAAAP
jgi:hypothetical protein